MLRIERLLGVVVLLKAVDVAERGSGGLSPYAWVCASAVFVAGGVLLVARPDRRAWALVLLGGVAVAIDAPVELRRQHLVLLIGVALAAVLTGGPDRLFLWRTQLATLYGFAVLAKLNTAFLGGDALAGAGWLPVPPTWVLLLGVATAIGIEVALCVAPLVVTLRRPGLGLAVLFHGATLVLVSTSALVGLRLVVFGGTAVLLHAASALGREPQVIQDGAGPVPSRQRAASSDGL